MKDFLKRNDKRKKSSNTPKANLKNERAKNKYFDFLKESQGFTSGTIGAIKKALYRYEEYTDFDNFSNFNQKIAGGFKKWIEEKKHPQTGLNISITTRYHYLRHLMDFFNWLAYQPGYKSRINLTNVEYLRLTREKARMATEAKREHFPTLEQIKRVVESIEIRSEVDMRNRALISFTLLSGMRDSAIISLPIGCFDENLFQVNQSPKQGVKTKFSKPIRSYLFKFDPDMLGYILDWVKHLKSEKLWGNSDPLFPKSQDEN
ncbi:MAG: hypothetical protein SFT81_05320 [Candidatus Caenarcaniphilales bacterium]|nr:hypothetical protein [Candidatus Caenarcaniphilales bacterium]